MANFIKNFFEILKGFGWKKYLLIILAIILILGIVFGAYYLVSQLFTIGTAWGIIGLVVLTGIIFAIQAIIVKKTKRDV